MLCATVLLTTLRVELPSEWIPPPETVAEFPDMVLRKMLSVLAWANTPPASTAARLPATVLSLIVVADPTSRLSIPPPVLSPARLPMTETSSPSASRPRC